MDLKYLQTFHQLCPNISILHLHCSPENLKNLEYLSLFKELNEIYFYSSFHSHISSVEFTKFLKSLKNHKMNAIKFVKFQEDFENISEFYKTLFSLKFTNFENTFSFYTEEISQLISSMIETNESLQTIDLNCKCRILIRSEFQTRSFLFRWNIQCIGKK
jgi:hypothetical protein